MDRELTRQNPTGFGPGISPWTIILALTVLTPPVSAQPVPCAVKTRYDAAESQLRRAEAELQGLQRKSSQGPRPASPASAQELNQAKVDLAAADKTLEEAGGDLQAAQKAQRDFAASADKGGRIKELSKQIEEKKAAIKKADEAIKNKKEQIDQFDQLERETKTLETSLSAQFPGLALNDTDAAKTQIGNEVARIAQKDQDIQTRSSSIKELLNGTRMTKSLEERHVSFSDIGLKCPEVTNLTARIDVQQRSVGALLDLWEKELDSEIRGNYGNKITKYEADIDEDQKKFLPAAKACEVSLVQKLNRLVVKRNELGAKDSDQTIKTLKMEPAKLAGEQALLAGQFGQLTKENQLLIAATKGAEVYLKTAQSAQGQVVARIQEIGKSVEVTTATQELALIKPDYDVVIQLKDQELNSAIDALGEANSLLVSLNMSRAELRLRVAAWKTSVAGWKTRAAAWKQNGDAQTRAQLVNEKPALVAEKKRLKEVNESCQKKQATGESLRARRDALQQYSCFDGVPKTINQIDAAVPKLLAFTPSSGSGTTYAGRVGPIASGASGLFAAIFSGSRARASFGNSFAPAAQANAAGEQKSTPPGCAPQEDLDIDLEAALRLPDPDRSGAMQSTLKTLSDQMRELRQNRAYFQTLQQQAAGQEKAAIDARNRAQELERVAHNTTQVLRTAGELCRQTSSAVAEMDRYQAEGEAFERSLTESLRQAEERVKSCRPGDAEKANQLYSDAIRAIGRLGVIEKKAKEMNVRLIQTARAAPDAFKVYNDVLARFSSFEKDLQTALTTKQQLADLVTIARSTRSAGVGLIGRIGAALAGAQLEVQRLSNTGSDRSMDSTAAQLKEIEKEYDSIKAYPSLVSVSDHASSAAAIVVTIETIKAQLQRYANDYKGVGCKFDTRDNVAEALESAARRADWEILLSADLPRQAQQCALRNGPCAQVGRDIRQLLVDGGIEEARTRIDAAKRQGCNVTDFEREFGDYKNIRDAAAYVHAMNEACRFQDAVDWAKQLPPFASSAQIVSREMRLSNDGLAAQSRVNTYLEQARQAVQSRNAAAVEQNLRTAEVEALRFPCLLTQVTQARASVRLPVPKVEEIPDITVNKPRPGALTSKVTVTPNKHEQHIAGYTDVRFTSTSAEFERENFAEKTRALFRWDFQGVPTSLTPGQTVVITVTGGVKSETYPGMTNGYTFAGSVNVYGDIEMKSGQQADRAHTTGRYEFVVRPNAKSVEIHLGGYPMQATAAIWKYGN